MKNTDLHVKILLLKCKSPLLKILVLENQCKSMEPSFGAAYAAPNEGTKIYTDLGLQKFSFMLSILSLRFFFKKKVKGIL